MNERDCVGSTVTIDIERNSKEVDTVNTHGGQYPISEEDL
jgi:hypothetical protein